MEGYIVEFAVEGYQSYSKAEEELKKGVRGRLVNEIPPYLD